MVKSLSLCEQDMAVSASNQLIIPMLILWGLLLVHRLEREICAYFSLSSLCTPPAGIPRDLQIAVLRDIVVNHYLFTGSPSPSENKGGVRSATIPCKGSEKGPSSCGRQRGTLLQSERRIPSSLATVD